MWRRSLLAVVLSLGMSSAVWAGPVEKSIASAPPPYDPLERWEIDLETGALWSIGSNASPLDYVILPQMVTFKSPYVFKGELFGGTIALRNRLSIAYEPIVEGPESYFFGLTGAGIVEWWNAERNFSLFFSAGGGIGWMDSKGYEVEGGQGQDFNYTWMLYSGVRFMPWEKVSVSVGAYFQHISNRGEDEINPGIDALGPMLSIGWHF